MLQNMIDDICTKDIIPIFSGHEVCEKNHKYGPHIRDYYLLHFCLNGKGVLIDKFGNHTIRQGELFIIRPGETTTYLADGNTPWEYSWVAFGGELADLFNTDRSVYPFPIEIGLSLREFSIDRETNPAIFLSLIYKLIYYLFNEKKDNSSIPEKIRQYIDFNYMDNISVLTISNYFGYERSYLYRIFKNHLGVGIKEYIIKTRMEHAQILLKKGYSVGNTSLAVGYNDQTNFSKAYKKHFGESPKKKE
jgi:AraC-like DNA-binding protein